MINNWHKNHAALIKIVNIGSKSKFKMKKNNKPQKIRTVSIDKILVAAQDEFILQGYKGATVQSIADSAGLPKANVLYYFKNKENINVNTMLSYRIVP